MNDNTPEHSRNLLLGASLWVMARMWTYGGIYRVCIGVNMGIYVGVYGCLWGVYGCIYGLVCIIYKGWGGVCTICPYLHYIH